VLKKNVQLRNGKKENCREKLGPKEPANDQDRYHGIVSQQALLVSLTNLR
jgi:hypothetical protein